MFFFCKGIIYNNHSVQFPMLCFMFLPLLLKLKLKMKILGFVLSMNVALTAVRLLRETTQIEALAPSLGLYFQVMLESCAMHGRLAN